MVTLRSRRTIGDEGREEDPPPPRQGKEEEKEQQEQDQEEEVEEEEQEQEEEDEEEEDPEQEEDEDDDNVVVKEGHIDVLFDDLARFFIRRYKKDLTQDQIATRRLRAECVRIRRKLFSNETAWVELDDLYDGNSLCYIVSRHRFETLLRANAESSSSSSLSSAAAATSAVVAGAAGASTSTTSSENDDQEQDFGSSSSSPDEEAEEEQETTWKGIGTLNSVSFRPTPGIDQIGPEPEQIILHTITAMPQYEHFSVEELRLQDKMAQHDKLHDIEIRRQSAGSSGFISPTSTEGSFTYGEDFVSSPSPAATRTDNTTSFAADNTTPSPATKRTDYNSSLDSMEYSPSPSPPSPKFAPNIGNNVVRGRGNGSRDNSPPAPPGMIEDERASAAFESGSVPSAYQLALLGSKANNLDHASVDRKEENDANIVGKEDEDDASVVREEDYDSVGEKDEEDGSVGENEVIGNGASDDDGEEHATEDDDGEEHASEDDDGEENASEDGDGEDEDENRQRYAAAVFEWKEEGTNALLNEIEVVVAEPFSFHARCLIVRQIILMMTCFGAEIVGDLLRAIEKVIRNEKIRAFVHDRCLSHNSTIERLLMGHDSVRIYRDICMIDIGSLLRWLDSPRFDDQGTVLTILRYFTISFRFGEYLGEEDSIFECSGAEMKELAIRYRRLIDKLYKVDDSFVLDLEYFNELSDLWICEYSKSRPDEKRQMLQEWCRDNRPNFLSDDDDDENTNLRPLDEDEDNGEDNDLVVIPAATLATAEEKNNLRPLDEDEDDGEDSHCNVVTPRAAAAAAPAVVAAAAPKKKTGQSIEQRQLKNEEDINMDLNRQLKEAKDINMDLNRQKMDLNRQLKEEKDKNMKLERQISGNMVQAIDNEINELGRIFKDAMISFSSSSSSSSIEAKTLSSCQSVKLNGRQFQISFTNSSRSNKEEDARSNDIHVIITHEQHDISVQGNKDLALGHNGHDGPLGPSDSSTMLSTNTLTSRHEGGDSVAVSGSNDDYSVAVNNNEDSLEDSLKVRGRCGRGELSQSPKQEDSVGKEEGDDQEDHGYSDPGFEGDDDDSVGEESSGEELSKNNSLRSSKSGSEYPLDGDGAQDEDSGRVEESSTDSGNDANVDVDDEADDIVADGDESFGSTNNDGLNNSHNHDNTVDYSKIYIIPHVERQIGEDRTIITTLEDLTKSRESEWAVEMDNATWDLLEATAENLNIEQEELVIQKDGKQYFSAFEYPRRQDNYTKSFETWKALTSNKGLANAPLAKKIRHITLAIRNDIAAEDGTVTYCPGLALKEVEGLSEAVEDFTSTHTNIDSNADYTFFTQNKGLNRIKDWYKVPDNAGILARKHLRLHFDNRKKALVDFLKDHRYYWCPRSSRKDSLFIWMRARGYKWTNIDG